MIWRKTILVVAALAAALAPVGARTQEEGSGNNLSYPALFTGARIPLNGTEGAFTLGATVLGAGLSYGCDRPEGTYPNTSCANAVGTFLTPDECVAVGMPCEGFLAADLQALYWQQKDANVWQAQWEENQGTIVATHVDWGDNLESVTWSERSIVRVETTPFATTLDAITGTGFSQTGFQMWHVADQGPDEMWGVRATLDGRPYQYASPYAIVHTPAMLNVTKIGAAAPCPTSPPDPGAPASPYAGALQWDPVAGAWSAPEGIPLHELVDDAYTVELNIGGKFVYGYNWNVKRAIVPQDLGKTGWWRLTFYTPGDTVDFSSPGILTDPPVLPGAAPAVVAAEAAVAAEAETGPLYRPVVHGAITWIDICIGTTRGGGRGGNAP